MAVGGVEWEAVRRMDRKADQAISLGNNGAKVGYNSDVQKCRYTPSA